MTHCIWGLPIVLRFCPKDEALRLSTQRWIVAKTLQPANFGFAPEPGKLALGVVAVSLASGSDGLLQRERAIKILPAWR